MSVICFGVKHVLFNNEVTTKKQKDELVDRLDLLVGLAKDTNSKLVLVEKRCLGLQDKKLIYKKISKEIPHEPYHEFIDSLLMDKTNGYMGYIRDVDESRVGSINRMALLSHKVAVIDNYRYYQGVLLLNNIRILNNRYNKILDKDNLDSIKRFLN